MAFLHTSYLGMPVWVWFLVLAVGGFNEFVNRAKWTEAESILQGIAAFILWIPAVGPVLAKFPIVGALLNKMAAKNPDAGKLPLPEPPPPVVPPAAAWLVFVILPTLLLGACVSAYCRDAANHDTARCKAERVVLNCGEPAVISLVKGIVAKVFGALMSSNFDSLLGDLQGQLTADGVKDGPGLIMCAINEVTSKSSLSPSTAEERTVIQTHADLYRNAHKDVQVKAR